MSGYSRAFADFRPEFVTRR